MGSAVGRLRGAQMVAAPWKCQTLTIAILATVLASTAALPFSLDNEVVELATVDEGGEWGDLYADSLEGREKDHKELGDSLGPHMAPEVRNPYGKQVADMENMKKEYKDVKRQHRKEQRMKYYSTARDTEEAVKKDVIAAQTVVMKGLPSPAENTALDAANNDLLNAEKNQHKAEHTGYN